MEFKDKVRRMSQSDFIIITERDNRQLREDFLKLKIWHFLDANFDALN